MPRFLAILVLGGCGPTEPTDRAPVDPLGPISEPLPGQGAQHHATLACDDEGCIAARQVGGVVRFSLLDADGTATTQTGPPKGPVGYNHPEIAAYPGGWHVVAATHGAPMTFLLDRFGNPTEATPLDEPYPWGLWPDAALGDDGRAHAFWSTKADVYWQIYDPAAPTPGVRQTWDLVLTQATVDPPAIAAVPGGYVRAWTVKNGFVWQVRLQWVDLDGNPLGEPVIAGEGDGTSRGARPQIASDDQGNVAVTWRVWPAIGIPPEGAYFRTFGVDGSVGQTVRLDVERGDRPTVEALPDGWLVAFEEAYPPAVFVQEFTTEGLPRTEPVAISDAPVEAGRANLALHREGDSWTGFVAWEEVYDWRVDAILDADVRVRAVRGVQ